MEHKTSLLQNEKMDICTTGHISILNPTHPASHTMNFLVEQIKQQQQQIYTLERKWKECKAEESIMKLQINRLTNTVKALVTLVPPPRPCPSSKAIPFPKIHHEKTTDPDPDPDLKTHTSLPPLRLIHPDNLQ